MGRRDGRPPHCPCVMRSPSLPLSLSDLSLLLRRRVPCSCLPPSPSPHSPSHATTAIATRLPPCCASLPTVPDVAGLLLPSSAGPSPLDGGHPTCQPLRGLPGSTTAPTTSCRGPVTARPSVSVPSLSRPAPGRTPEARYTPKGLESAFGKRAAPLSARAGGSLSGFLLRPGTSQGAPCSRMRRPAGLPPGLANSPARPGREGLAASAGGASARRRRPSSFFSASLRVAQACDNEAVVLPLPRLLGSVSLRVAWRPGGGGRACLVPSDVVSSLQTRVPSDRRVLAASCDPPGGPPPPSRSLPLPLGEAALYFRA